MHFSKILIVSFLSLFVLFNFSCEENNEPFKEEIALEDPNVECLDFDLMATREKTLKPEFESYSSHIFETHLDVQAIYLIHNYEGQENYFIGVSVIPPTGSTMLTACNCNEESDINASFFVEISQFDAQLKEINASSRELCCHSLKRWCSVFKSK